MPKYFPGVSYAIVRTMPDKESMDAMDGTMAFVDLCFDSDTSAIRFIGIKKMAGPTTGATAHVPKTVVAVKANGDRKYAPVLEFKVADEARLLALKAFDRVKQQYGLKFNKIYRVLDKIVEDLTVETPVGVTNA